MAAVSMVSAVCSSPDLASTSAVVIRSMTCQCGDGGPLSAGVASGQLGSLSGTTGRQQPAQADLPDGERAEQHILL
jgi:hypothetical protein